jgi:putative ABC transport system ATP-binding protein
VSLTVAEGEWVSVVGPSGCGKTTLLNIAGLVDTPTSGSVRLGGLAASGLPDRERTRLRLTTLGFVFQRFHLLPMLTALENVELPQEEARAPAAARRRRGLELLDAVGLAGRAHHRPDQLSGGEMQRVALARALANRPRLLLADEPTGELDRKTGAVIADLFSRWNREGLALVLVTHDHELAARGSRVVQMEDGRLVEGAP